MASLNLGVKGHIVNVLKIIDDSEAVKSYLSSHGVPEPKAKTEQGYKARLLCSKWWHRTLDRLNQRTIEADLIKKGKVARNREIYTSNHTLKRVVRKAVSTNLMLKNMVMQSDEGETVSMQEIMEHSIANPVNRRAELMIRMAGFEIYAKENGFVGEFYTITTPSKYHRFSGTELNPVYDHTPKEAQAYLVKQWSKIRAKFDREKIKPFGFRVAEPHHDGCPHWHMLLFIKPEQRELARSIVSEYALEHDGEEKGAKQHRFTHVEIYPEVGTATGYIAKYISKNLGFSIDDVDNDINAKSTEYGQRVKAWASVWGIRQFQQIGGAPVTVWRQLRKLDVAPDGVLEQARQAADESRWADYLAIMGGPNTKRVELEIQLLKKKQFDIVTGELKSNRYTEILDVIYGVTALSIEAVTRYKNWSMTSAKQALMGVESCGVSRAALLPWSPVNNCTV